MYNSQNKDPNLSICFQVRHLKFELDERQKEMMNGGAEMSSGEVKIPEMQMLEIQRELFCALRVWMIQYETWQILLSIYVLAQSLAYFLLCDIH